MNATRLCINATAAMCVTFLCSCVTQPVGSSRLPAEVAFNKEAGTRDWLYVTLRLGDGKEVLCDVDTGAPVTVLDKSLEPELGKRVAENKIGHVYYKTATSAYRAPKLYLGGVPLLTGDWVWTDDYSCHASRTAPGRRILGTLGMDCLRHYRIQLDFAAGKMRFLDPKLRKGEDLGKAFRLIMTRYGYIRTRETLTGAKGTSSLLDTGCLCDGVLEPRFFDKALRQEKAARTREWKDPTGWTRNTAWFPQASFGGETYANLFIDKAPKVSKDQTRYLGDLNAIGLMFLARHSVTLDFPNKTMYLQRMPVDPQAQQPIRHEVCGAKELLNQLRELNLAVARCIENAQAVTWFVFLLKLPDLNAPEW